MNDPELEVTFESGGDLAVTAPEMQLLADLLPELVKDLLWLQYDTEA